MKKTTAILLFAAFACGDSTTPPEYDDVSGTFEGPMKGTTTLAGPITGTLAIDATATFTIQQTAGNLTVDWMSDGKVSLNGQIVERLSGTERGTGTIAKGRDPAVTFTFRGADDLCPDVSELKLAGTHRSEETKFELSVGFPLIDDDSCQKLGEVPLTGTLTKK